MTTPPRSDLPRIRANTVAEVLLQLRAAQRVIAQRLAAAGDTLTRQRLIALQQEVARAMESFRTGASAAAAAGSAAAAQDGAQQVALPLRQQGIDLSPRINPQTLLAMRESLTDLISDVSTRTVNRINAQLAHVLVGTQPMSAAITNVQRLMDGAARYRARTIVYTELGRINSVATQQGLQQAAERLPGLKKRWVKSGKKHPRDEHADAHGQLRAINEPFDVGGEQLMFPRDPEGSAKNTINCGCRHIPVVDGSSWGASTVKLDMDSPNAMPLNVVRDPDAE